MIANQADRRIAANLPGTGTLSASGQVSGTPTGSGGVYTFTAKVTDPVDSMAGVQQFRMLISAPTAASVSVAGRVLTPDGRGLTNALVTLTDQNGNTRTVISSGFGYYRFENVQVGQLYIFTVQSKRYTLEPQTNFIISEMNDLNFTAAP